MKKILFAAFILAVSVTALKAQNLNPKVQVVNDYDVSVSDANKGGIELLIPDSLLRFDYKFEYDYFQSVYKGAYDVSRYFVRTTPGVTQHSKRQFFMSTGVSYNSSPELNLDWQAVNGDRYCLDIGNDFGGYHGKFAGLQNSDFVGYDFTESLDIANVFRFKLADMKLDAGYDGIFNNCLNGQKSDYNSAYAKARITAAKRFGSYFYYDFGVQYRYSHDSFASVGPNDEHLVEVEGAIGPTIKKDRYKIFLDFGYTFESNKGYLTTNSSLVMLKPHVDLILGKFNLDIGARLTYSTRFSVFPDVTASVKVADDYLNLFVGVRGGEELNSYSSLKFHDHSYCGMAGQLGTTSLERVNAFFGFSGFAGTSFNYMVKGGFSNHYGEAVRSVDTNPAVPSPRIDLIDCNKAYVKLMLGWTSERFDSDITFDYTKTWVIENDTVIPEGRVVFLTPDFKLDANLTYNWARRIFVGASLIWNSEAKTYGASFRSTPAFFDLGVNLKYKIDDRWGVWLKGSNLLNQDIWYSDFYARKGLAFTAGFTLGF